MGNIPTSNDDRIYIFLAFQDKKKDNKKEVTNKNTVVGNIIHDIRIDELLLECKQVQRKMQIVQECYNIEVMTT